MQSQLSTPQLRIEKPPVRNLADVLSDQAARQADNCALVFKARRVTYGELNDRSLAIASQLVSLGLKPGDKIGLLFPNQPDYVATFFAILRIGAVLVPVNPLLKSDEIAHILADSSAKALVVHSKTMDEAVKALPSLEGLEHLIIAPAVSNQIDNAPGRLTVSALTDAVKAPDAIPPAIETDPRHDLAFIVYTSGTTGKPKGAMISHHNLSWVLPDRLFSTFDIDHSDRFLGLLPFSHMYGLGVIIYGTISRGGTIVIMEKFEPKEALKTIEREGVTLIPAVPAMYQFMLMEMESDEYDLSSLRICFCAAAPLSTELLSLVEEGFGAPVVEGYGMTETACGATINPMHGRKTGSVGRALPGIDIVIKSPDGRKLLPGSENVGEIVIRGDQIMVGYHNRPEATDEVMEDGWLHTGDLGWQDDQGYFYICGRKKELIIRGGQNIYPRELEDVIIKMPGVAEVAVIGVPDKFMGERVKAFVVKKSAVTLSEDDIKEYCSNHLAAYKVPRLVEFIDTLPRNSTGKVLKRMLS